MRRSPSSFAALRVQFVGSALSVVLSEETPGPQPFIIISLMLTSSPATHYIVSPLPHHSEDQTHNIKCSAVIQTAVTWFSTHTAPPPPKKTSHLILDTQEPLLYIQGPSFTARETNTHYWNSRGNQDKPVVQRNISSRSIFPIFCNTLRVQFFFFSEFPNIICCVATAK